MKVGTSGNIIIQMHSEPSHDIDFCCWGPFTSQNCCTELLCNKVVSCSYSPLPYETCTINNAVTGQYYMLVITNYSNLPCNIIFSQTGGTGTTDCSIMAPPASNNSPICINQTLQLTASNVANATYHWSGPAGFNSNVQNPSIPNAQLINAGDYYLRVTVNGQPSTDSSKTTAIIYKPLAHAGNDTTIPNGTKANLHGSASQGSGSYHYHWSPESLVQNPDWANTQTLNLDSTVVFKLTVTDDSVTCLAEDFKTVSISGGALAVNAIAMPSTLCAGVTTELQAISSGGTGIYTYQWTGPNGFTSTLQNPTVQPPVTSDYTVQINDGYNTRSSTVTVHVNQLPIADAGADKSINYGIYVYLSGSVTGGTSYYNYSWSPAEKLINPFVQYPQTVLMNSTTIFSLQVTDMATTCVSSNQANMTVEVLGGPLNTNPTAIPDWICLGDTSHIHGLANGGNVGHYEYTWTSDPPGFTSSDPDPVVSPTQNTTYHLSVWDGYNTATGSTTLTLYPQPLIHLGPPDTTICIYDTLVLDAGNPGATYLWDHGATSRTIPITATGISDETQHYGVKVTNEHDCATYSEITIHFTFNACTGIHENGSGGRVSLYPNPSSGILYIESDGIKQALSVTVFSIHGKKIKSLSVPAGNNKPSKQAVDLEGVAKGVYIVRFSSGDFIGTEKLIIK
jgi:hypothetical protein